MNLVYSQNSVKEIIPNDKTKGDYWTWKELKIGGILTINHLNSNHIIILK
jgi:hypothetical protein